MTGSHSLLLHCARVCAEQDSMYRNTEEGANRDTEEGAADSTGGHLCVVPALAVTGKGCGTTSSVGGGDEN